MFKLLPILLVFIQFYTGEAQSLSVEAEENNHVVIISIDGFSANVLNNEDTPVPVIRELAKKGARAKAMTTSNPTNTWPSHTTLVTGVGADRHHVLFNGKLKRSGKGLPVRVHTAVDREELLSVPTLYDIAYENGLRTAEVNWPVTRNAGTLHDSFPDTPNSVGHMTDDLLWEIVEAEILKDATNFALWNRSRAGRDSVWTETASFIIENRMPSLLMLHLLNVDGAHHRTGLGSEESMDALVLADQHVGQVINSLEKAGVRERTTIFIVSDHGFTDSRKSILPNVLLREKGLLKVQDGVVVDAEVQVVTVGGTAMVYFQNPDDLEMIQEVAEFFEGLEGIGKVVHYSQFNEYGLPLPSETDQSGQLLLAANPGYSFIGDAHREQVVVESSQYGYSIGAHGYMNDLVDMDSIFIVSGNGVESGKVLDRIDSRSVAPTAAALLGLTLPDAEGSVLWEIFRSDVERTTSLFSLP
ncbi:MAG: alkaline phosphatase family protein [Balneolaceae bacterium]|nr:alkaline phosphatase family protein [Balneolaceae bacterium]MCH8547604.1 alkaline phosphatase family protein [Balneolaceae bacterium]